MRKLFAAAAVAVLMLAGMPAEARGSHYVHGYHRHNGTYVPPHYARNPVRRHHAKPRGETCWRTNRHTGAHFRIC